MIINIPQGSPISPLLSNILLHELDRFLEKKKIRFVRYADDFSIYTKTKSAAKQLGNMVYVFLRDKLKLPINREKSGIRNPSNFTILGFDFVPTYKKGDKGKYQIVVAKKSWKKIKQKLKKVTRKTTPMSFEERIQKLNQIQRGWVNNYRMASIQLKLEKLDGWVRNRLRYCIWHQWKKSNKRKRSLIRLGIEAGQAYAWSRTRMGGWAVAQSPILNTTITLERLKKRGYVSMSKIYSEISPRLNEPPYTRPVRTVV
jgi:RNA-directed DNA polymerase